MATQDVMAKMFNQSPPKIYHPPSGAPPEKLIYANDMEQQILRLLGGSGQMTEHGIPSFTDPSQAQGNSLGSKPTQTTSSAKSGTSNHAPSGGSGGAQVRDQKTGTMSNSGSKTGYDGGSNSRGGGGDSSSTQTQTSNGGFKPSGDAGGFKTSPSNANSGSDVKQGSNYSAADYARAGYGDYQQPPSHTFAPSIKQSLFADSVSQPHPQIGSVPDIHSLLDEFRKEQAAAPGYLNNTTAATPQRQFISMDSVPPVPQAQNFSTAYQTTPPRPQMGYLNNTTALTPRAPTMHAWPGGLGIPGYAMSDVPASKIKSVADMDWMTGGPWNAQQPTAMSSIFSPNSPIRTQTQRPTQVAQVNLGQNYDATGTGPKAGLQSGPETMPDPSEPTIARATATRPQTLAERLAGYQAAIDASRPNKVFPTGATSSQSDLIGMNPDSRVFRDKLQEVTDANSQSPQVQISRIMDYTPLGHAINTVAGLRDKANGGFYGGSPGTRGGVRTVSNQTDDSHHGGHDNTRHIRLLLERMFGQPQGPSMVFA